MDIFKKLIFELTPLLKQIGFSKKGNTYYTNLDANYGAINFQKSRDSTDEIVKFTINFGVYSDILGQLEHGISNSNTDVESCQWQARIGNFLPNQPDFWWKISLSDNLNELKTDVFDQIKNIALPEIDKRLSNQGLIDCWINESFAGTTEIGRFKYLTTLLKSNGDFEMLDKTVTTFVLDSKGKPNFALANNHLNNIDYH